MGKGKRARVDSDDDDAIDPDLPIMNPTPAQQAAAAAAAPSTEESWQRCLMELLSRWKQSRDGNKPLLCPFTRRGLTELYQASPELYAKVRTRSEFSLVEDPESKHMTGGHSYCNCSSEFPNAQRLKQHCGGQPAGKTVNISRSAPALNDPQAWKGFGKEEQLHFLLLMWASGSEQLEPGAAPVRHSAQEPTALICWPPMLFAKFTPASTVQWDSQGILRQKFPGCSNAYPVYTGEGFQHMAILVFDTKSDDNAHGYELADARLKENHAQLDASNGRPTFDGVTEMRWCTPDQDRAIWERERERARQRNNKSWCDNLLRHHSPITSVKQYEKAKELTDQREAKRLQAEAEKKQHEAERSQWEEERAQIDARYQKQLDEIKKERDERQRAAAAYTQTLEQRADLQCEQYSK